MRFFSKKPKAIWPEAGSQQLGSPKKAKGFSSGPQ
jgi:hypothetical protein